MHIIHYYLLSIFCSGGKQSRIATGVKLKLTKIIRHLREARIWSRKEKRTSNFFLNRLEYKWLNDESSILKKQESRYHYLVVVKDDKLYYKVSK